MKLKPRGDNYLENFRYGIKPRVEQAFESESGISGRFAQRAGRLQGGASVLL